jgi:hypothetical protein
MARKVVRSIRFDPEDARALERARADGLSPSELVSRGLRSVAADYYKARLRRPPRVTLLVSTDPHLGEESLLFKD